MRTLLFMFVCLPPLLAQTAELRSARYALMPAPVDSNSPAIWIDGLLYLFNSSGMPLVSRGFDPFSQIGTEEVSFDRYDHFPLWLESAWLDDDGTLYGWYHHEPGGVCGNGLTAPQIGAVVSYDGGSTFQDLGIVLASGDPPDCNAQNGFFASGNGDFSVIVDRERKYFYFLFTNYGGDVSGQGVSIARMAVDDRHNPAGAVWKYFAGDWTEPGLGGRVTPIFPATVGWEQANTDSFWGPSVHWNEYLQTYVVLLTRACCAPRWPAEGIYVTFNPDISDPAGWNAPAKILQKGGYYPQVLGTSPGESDTLAGQVARFYIQGESKWEIVFSQSPPN